MDFLETLADIPVIGPILTVVFWPIAVYGAPVWLFVRWIINQF